MIPILQLQKVHEGITAIGQKNSAFKGRVFYLVFYTTNCTSLCLLITITYTEALVISVANIEFICLE